MATYNPSDILVTVNGVPVTGYSDGTDVIGVDYESDFVGDAVGVTGEGAFVEMNDHRATITLKLLATSLMNDVLSGLVAANTEFAMSMTDERGTTIAAGAACRIQKLPVVAFGNEVGEREWNIRCLEWIEHVGGNTS
jgi:hypothetical protein